MAEKMQRLYLVFPVFNEAENLSTLFADLVHIRHFLKDSSWNIHTIFIDDGSTDETPTLLSNCPDATFLRHPHNQGPGSAFQTAFSHLLHQGLESSDLVVTLEADATSHPHTFMRMLQRSKEGDDVILASPYLQGGGLQKVSWYRMVLSHFANGLVKLFLGLRGISTFSCFFRVYRGHTIQILADAYGMDKIVTLKGFECAVEILYKIIRCGLTVSEVPFFVDWSRRKGKSKMRILTTSWGYFRLFGLSWTRAFKPQQIIRKSS